MKRFVNFLLLIVAVLLLFAGCQSRSQSLDLAICGSYGVPGMFCSDLKGGTYKCNVLETDQVGRILFEYTAQSIVTGETETAVVICQKYDSKYVYFYEDRCYLLGDFDESAMAQLKSENDWGRVLNEDKMVKRSNKLTFDLSIITASDLEYKKVCSACCRELEIEMLEIEELCFMDQDPYGKVLYWLSAETDDYCVMVNSDYEVMSMKVEGTWIDAEALAEFKQSNGWNKM